MGCGGGKGGGSMGSKNAVSAADEGEDSRRRGREGGFRVAGMRTALFLMVWAAILMRDAGAPPVQTSSSSSSSWRLPSEVRNLTASPGGSMTVRLEWLRPAYVGYNSTSEAKNCVNANNVSGYLSGDGSICMSYPLVGYRVKYFNVSCVVETLINATVLQNKTSLREVTAVQPPPNFWYSKAWVNVTEVRLVPLVETFNISSTCGPREGEVPFDVFVEDAGEGPQGDTVHVDIGGLVPGASYLFVVVGVVEGGTVNVGEGENATNVTAFLEGRITHNVTVRVLAAPTPPKMLTVGALRGGLHLSWSLPDKVGRPVGYGEEAADVLKGYDLTISANASPPPKCLGVDAGLCVHAVLPSDTVAFQAEGLTGGNAFHASLKAFNEFGYSLSATQSVDVTGPPKSVGNLAVSLPDHNVLRLDWEAPADSGLFSGGVERYLVEIAAANDSFITCPKPGPLQCYSTLELPPEINCRSCQVRTCGSGEVCFSAELRLDGDVTLPLMGCGNESIGADGVCEEGLASRGVANCRTCTGSLCNNLVPKRPQDTSCLFPANVAYCVEGVRGYVLNATSMLPAAFTTPLRRPPPAPCDIASEPRGFNVSTLNFTAGSSIANAYPTDDGLRLVEGTRYFFRVSACTAVEGCGPFASASFTARLVQAEVTAGLFDQGAGSVAYIVVRMTTTKLITDPEGYFEVVWPAKFGAPTAAEAKVLGATGGQIGEPTMSVYRDYARGMFKVSRGPGGHTIPAGSVFEIGLTGARNPGVSGQYCCFSVSAHGGGIKTDEGTSNATILAGNFNDFNETGVSVSEAVAGAVSNISLSLRSRNAVPLGGAWKVTIPSGFVPGPRFDARVHGVPDFSYRVEGLNVWFMGTAEYPFTVIFYDVRMPLLSSTTPDFAVTSLVSDCPEQPWACGAGPVIDHASVPGVCLDAIAMGPNFVTTLSPAAPPFGALVDFTFTYAHEDYLNELAPWATNNTAGVGNMSSSNSSSNSSWSLYDLGVEAFRLKIVFSAGFDFSEALINATKGSFDDPASSSVPYGQSNCSSASCLLTSRMSSLPAQPCTGQIGTKGVPEPEFQRFEVALWIPRNTTGNQNFTVQVKGMRMAQYVLGNTNDTVSAYLEVANHRIVASTQKLVEYAPGNFGPPFEFEPGLFLPATVRIKDPSAGALSYWEVDVAASENFLPNPFVVVVHNPGNFVFSDIDKENVAYVLWGQDLNVTGTAEVDESLSDDSKISLLLNVTGPETLNLALFRVGLSGVRNPAWSETGVSFRVQILDPRIKGMRVMRVIAESKNVQSWAGFVDGFDVFPTKLDSAGVQMAEATPSETGTWDKTRVVASEMAEVHLGISIVPSLHVPRASWITVISKEAGTSVRSVRPDPAFFYRGTNGTFAVGVDVNQAVRVTQTDASCDALACITSGTAIRVNLLANVSVTEGNWRGRSRSFRVELWQNYTGKPTMMQFADVTSSDAVIPGRPKFSFNWRRRRSLLSETVSSSSVALANNRAGEAGDVSLQFTLEVNLTKTAVMIVVFPPDTNLTADMPIVETYAGFDGGISTIVKATTLVVVRDPADASFVYRDGIKSDCKTVGGTVPTGTPCNVPFVYKDVTYKSCTTFENDGVPWCSTTPSFYGLWGNCNCVDTPVDLTVSIKIAGQNLAMLSPPVCEAKAAPCHFPFTWGSVQYYECIDTPFPQNPGGIPWCSIKPVFDPNKNSSSDEFQWGPCNCTYPGWDRAWGVTNPRFAGGAAYSVVVIDDATSEILAIETDMVAEIVPRQLAGASIELSPGRTGAVTGANVSLVLSNLLDADGSVELELPEGFECAGVAAAELSVPLGALNVTCIHATDASSLVISMTRLGAGSALPRGTRLTLNISGVLVRESSGNASVTLRTRTGARLGRAVSDAVGIVIEVAPSPLELLRVSVTSLIAGRNDGAASISFRTPNGVPPHGGIHVALPGGFSIKDPSLEHSWKLCGTVGGTQNLTVDNVVIFSDEVLIRLSADHRIARGAIVSFDLPNLSNPARSGTTEPWVVRTLNAFDNIMDQESASGPTLVPDMLQSAEVRLLSRRAGDVTTAVVIFTASNPVSGNGGMVRVNFPEQFTLVVPVSDGASSGFGGMLSVSGYGPQDADGVCHQQSTPPGCQVNLTMSGAGVPAMGRVSFGIANVQLMGSSGLTGSFTIQTVTPNGYVIDEVTVTHAALSPAKLGFASVAPVGPFTAGNLTTLRVSLATSNPLGAGSSVVVVFPSPSFDLFDTCPHLAGTSCISGDRITAEGALVSSNAAVGPANVTISLLAAIPAETEFAFHLVGVKAPNVSGVTPPYQILTVSASGAVIDADYKVLAPPVDPGDLRAEVMLSPAHAGSLSTLTVSVGLTNPFPPGARLEVECDYDVGLAPSAAVSGPVEAGALSLKVTGRVITVSRKHGLMIEPYTKFTLVISGVRNPPVAGYYAYTVRTSMRTTQDALTGTTTDETAATVPIDTTTRMLHIAPGAMPLSEMHPAALNVGDRATLRLRFRVANMLPADGIVSVTFPAEAYDLGAIVSSSVATARSTVSLVTYTDGSTCTNVEGQTVNVTRSGGGAIPAGTLVDVELSNLHAIGSSGIAGEVILRTLRSDGGLLDEALLIHGELLDGVLSQTSAWAEDPSAGAVTRVNLTFWAANNVPPGGFVQITVPPGASVDDETLACKTSFSAESVSYTNGAISLVAVAGIGTEDAVAVSCVGTTLRRWSGPARYNVRTLGAGGRIIDSGSPVLETLPHGLGMFEGGITNLYAGNPTSLAVSFVTANPVPAGGQFVVSLPAGFGLAPYVRLSVRLGVGDASLAWVDSSFDAVNNTAVVVLPLGLDAGTVVNATVWGLANRQFAGPAVWAVSTRTRPTQKYGVWGADDDRAIDLQEIAWVVLASPMQDPTVAPQTYIVGGRGDYTFAATTFNALPAGGSVFVTFPEWYDVSGVSAGSALVGGVDGFSTVQVEGQKVIFVRLTGAAVQPGTRITIKVANIGNPPFELVTGDFVVETVTAGYRDGTARAIERAVVGGILVVRSRLTTPGSYRFDTSRATLEAGPGVITVEPVMLRAGQASSLNISFWTVNEVPQGGAVVVRLPRGYTLGNVQCSASDALPAMTVEIVDTREFALRLAGGMLRESSSLSLSCKGIYATPHTGMAENYEVFTIHSAGGIIDSGLATGVVRSGSLLPASVTPRSTVAGATGDVWVVTTLANPLPHGGTLEVDLPGGFVLPMGLASVRVVNESMAGVASAEWNASVAVRGYSHALASHPQAMYTLTLLRVGAGLPSGATASFVVGGVRNRMWSGGSGTFQLRTRLANGTLVDGCDPQNVLFSYDCGQEFVKSVMLSPAYPCPASISLETYMAGKDGRMILSFVTNTTLFNDSRVELTAPSGFRFDPIAALSGFYTGIHGGLFASVGPSGERATLRRVSGDDVPVGTLVQLEFAGFTNKVVSTCSLLPPGATCAGEAGASGGGVTLRILTAHGFATDEHTIALGAVEPSELNHTSVALSALVAGGRGHADVSFMTANPLPADGQILVTFPAGFTFANPILAQAVSGLDGLLAVKGVNGTRLMIHRFSGTAVEAGVQVKLNVTGIVTRPSAGPAGPFIIRTRTSDGALIDHDTDVAPAVISPGLLRGLAAVPGSLVAGSITSLALSFSLANPLPRNGSITIRLPPGSSWPTALFREGGTLVRDVAREIRGSGSLEHVAPFAVVDSGMDGLLDMSVESPTQARLTRINASAQAFPCAACVIRVTVYAVTHRPRSGEAGLSYRVRTHLSSGEVIDDATLVRPHPLVPGVLRRTSVMPSSGLTGHTTRSLVTFVAPNGLPERASVEVTFPEGFVVTGSRVGFAAQDSFRSEGGALVALSRFNFTSATANSSSGVPGDSAEITVSFTLNAVLDARHQTGLSVVITGLNGSQTPSGSIPFHGPSASLLGGFAAWTRETGSLRLNISQGVPAGEPVTFGFFLVNPSGVNHAGAGLTIKASEGPCGNGCFPMSTAAASLPAVLTTGSATAAWLVNSIGSMSAIVNEEATITATLKANFVLEAGSAVVVDGLNNSATPSGNLSAPYPFTSAGPFKPYFQWDQAGGKATFTLVKRVVSSEQFTFAFALRNGPGGAAASPRVSISGQFLGLGFQSMNATDVLHARDMPTFSACNVSQDSSVIGGVSKVTVRVRPTAVLPNATRVTITGLTGNDSPSDALLPLYGPGAALFGGTAVWDRAAGKLVLTQAAKMLDNAATEVSFLLRGSKVARNGTKLNATSSQPWFLPAQCEGAALRAADVGEFEVRKLLYSTNRTYSLNTITVTLQPNTNMLPGAKVTITQLPSADESDALSVPMPLSGHDASLFGGSGTWVPSTGLLELTVAPGHIFAAHIPRVFTFVLRNGGLSSPGTERDFAVERDMLDPVQPYVELNSNSTNCTTMVVPANSTTFLSALALRDYVAQLSNVEPANKVLVKAIAAGPGGMGMMLDVCILSSFSDTSNQYGYVPSVGSPLSGIAFHRLTSAPMVVTRLCGANSSFDVGNNGPFGFVSDATDPSFTVRKVGYGSAVRGAITSISVTMMPNWELVQGTKIDLCCFANMSLPTLGGSPQIALNGPDGAIFGSVATFNETSGLVSMTVQEGLSIPCSSPSMVVFSLRNSMYESVTLPPIISAMGSDHAPGSVMIAPYEMDAQVHANLGAGAGYVKIKAIADTSDAFGGGNLITATLQFNVQLFAGDTITISGLAGASDSPGLRHGAFTGRFNQSWDLGFGLCSDSFFSDCSLTGTLVLTYKDTSPLQDSEVVVVGFILNNSPYRQEPVTPVLFLNATGNKTAGPLPMDSRAPSSTGDVPDRAQILAARSVARLTDLKAGASSTVLGAMSTITVSMTPNVWLEAGTNVTISGLVDECYDRTDSRLPLPFCRNLQNPSSPDMPVFGPSSALFGGRGEWDALHGALVITSHAEVASGQALSVSFVLRNRGDAPFQGSEIYVKAQGLYHEINDGIEVMAAGRTAVMRRTSGSAIPPGETVSFTLDGVRNREWSGPTGLYGLRTRTQEGDVIDEDGEVDETLLRPAPMQAAVRVLDKRTAGRRGRVSVAMLPTNEVPTGGAILVFFPHGYQLDTGHNDAASALAPSTYGDVAGLQVSSPDMRCEVRIASNGSVWQDTGLGLEFVWWSTAIVTNLGAPLPRGRAVNFILANVQYPLTSGTRGTFEVRTFTERGESINEALNLAVDEIFDPGNLTEANVEPHSLLAGAVGGITVSFVTENPIPPDGIIDIGFPEGFTAAGDAASSTVSGIDFSRSLDGAFSVDFDAPATGYAPGKASMAVGGIRARNMAAEAVEGLDGTLEVVVKSSRLISVYRRGADASHRGVKVVMRLYDPTTSFDVTAPVIGVKNPGIAGPTGAYSVKTRLYDGTVIDQNLRVPGDLISPGMLTMLQVTPESLVAGNRSALDLSFAVSNPLPADGRVSVTLPEGVQANVSMRVRATSPNLDGGLSVSFSGGNTITVSRTGDGLSVLPCSAPMCNTANVVRDGRANASNTQPPSQASKAFSGPSQQWQSGPSIAAGSHWVEYDFMRPVSVCSFSFASRFDNYLGYVSSDGPTSYVLQGSADGIVYEDLHPRVVNGPPFSSVDERRQHGLLRNFAYPRYRLLITGVPGRTSGSQYAVVRDLRLTSPTGADPHTSPTESRCHVSLRIDGLFENRGYSGQSGAYTIRTLNGAAGNMVVDQAYANAGADLTPGPLSEAALSLSSRVAGEQAYLNVTLRVYNRLPADGQVEIVLPEGVGLASLSGTQAESAAGFGMAGQVKVAGRSVVISRDAASNQAVPAGRLLQFSIGPLANPGISGPFGAVSILTRLVDGTVIDAVQGVAPKDIVFAAIPDASVGLASDRAGSSGSLGVNFTAVNGIPVGGVITIELPDLYVPLTPLYAAVVGGFEGDFVADANYSLVYYNSTHNGSLLLITLKRVRGSAVARGTRVRISVSAVLLPPRAASSGSFSLCTRHPTSLFAIDCSTAGIAPATLLPSPLSDVVVRPSVLTTGSEGLEVGFTVTNTILAGDVIQISLPSTFLVPAANLTVEGVSVEGSLCPEKTHPMRDLVTAPRLNFTIAVKTEYPYPLVFLRLTVPSSSGLAPRGSTVRMLIRQLRAPSHQGLVGPFTVQTEAPGGLVRDKGTAGSVYIEKGAIDDALVALSTRVAGSLASVTVTFSSRNNAVPAGGRIEVSFPPSFGLSEITEYTLESPAGTVVSRVEGALPADPMRRQNVASIPLNTMAVSGSVRIQLSNVRLQRFSGPTGSFGVRTLGGPFGNATIDDNQSVQGTILSVAPLRDTSVTPVTLPTDPAGTYAAGARGRLLVKFTPSNPVPPDGVIAVVLPPWFDVALNSSVAVPVGSEPASLYPAERLDNTGYDGVLIAHVHSSTVVTISRAMATLPALADAPLSFFLDGVRNPAFAGKVGAFQLRTLLRTGAPIDQDLDVTPTGVVIPGSFEGVCPPYCKPPMIRPDSDLAGKLTSISVVFTPSVPIPADGEIDFLLPLGTVADPMSLRVITDSLLGDDAGTVRALDGGFESFAKGRVLRVRRDGAGKEVHEGVLVSFTIEGIRNGEKEGYSGDYELRTLTSKRELIEEKVAIPGIIIVPNSLAAFTIVRSVYAALVESTMTLSITPSTRIPRGGVIALDTTGEKDATGAPRNLLSDLPAGCIRACRCTNGASCTACCLVIAQPGYAVTVSSGQIAILYDGAEAIEALTPITLTISGLSNPPFEQVAIYKVETRTSSGERIDTGSADVTYSYGMLVSVSMHPESFVAGSLGFLRVYFTVTGPLPPNGRILIELPGSFEAPSRPVARQMDIGVVDGLLAAFLPNNQSSSVVEVTRILGTRSVPPGRVVGIELSGVLVQRYSGATGPVQVTTKTLSGSIINVGSGPPVTMVVGGGSATNPSTVSVQDRTAGAVTEMYVTLYARGPIPPDGRILVQMPPGFTLAELSTFLLLSGEPVKSEMIQGTYVHYAPVSPPYYASTSTDILLPPAAVDLAVSRGPSVLLTRLGGGSTLTAGSRVDFTLRGLRIPPTVGLTGTFQISTMVNSYALLDQNGFVTGIVVKPGSLTDVSVATSSIVSDAPVEIKVNFTTSNLLPRSLLVDIAFPPGYRDLETSVVSAGSGLTGALATTVATRVGGTQVMRVRRVGLDPVPAGTAVQLIIRGVRNRIFSSVAQYFQVDTRLDDDASSGIDAVIGVTVPPASGDPPAFFALVAQGRDVVAFDPRGGDGFNTLFTLDEGDTTIQGVSALDTASSSLFLVSGGKLVVVDLTQPGEVPLQLLLRSGADAMGGIASMRWDPSSGRLLALAVLDGDAAMVTVDPLLGTLARLSDLPACGSCECSPAQGVAALDAASGRYFAASSVTLFTVSTVTGNLINQAPLLREGSSFQGFAALEYDTTGKPPLYDPLGLIGIALLEERVELVKIDEATGTMHSLISLFDESFTGMITGGVSALNANTGVLYFVASGRLVAADLATKAVSFYRKSPGLAPDVWSLLEMMSFLPPPYSDAPASTVVATSSFSGSTAALNISLLGLGASVPVPSAVSSDTYFAVTLTGSDVVALDEIKASLGRDCSATLPGGGPFSVSRSGTHTQRFSLRVNSSVSAQICYSSKKTADRSFKPIAWSGGKGGLNATFDVTPVAFAITLAPSTPRMQGRVTMTIRGSLSDGDAVRFVQQDARIAAGQECQLGLPVPGIDLFTLVGLGPLLRTTDKDGSAMEIAIDTSLVSAQGMSVHVCYRAAAGSLTPGREYSLIVGRSRASEADVWEVGSVFAVPGVAGGGEGAHCSNATMY